MTRFRVRGTYSTALTKLLIGHGFEVVQPSAVIKERFKLTDAETPPDLDIYDRPDRQGVYVVGEDSSLDAFISVLQSSLGDVIIRRRTTRIERSSLNYASALKSTVKDAEDAPLGSEWSLTNVEFPSVSKENLDALRSSVTPTIKRHHYLKACGGRISSLLEMAEKLLEKNASRSEVEALLEESVKAEYPRVGSRVDIEHVKIDGRLFHLSNAEIVDYDEEEGTLQVRRVFKKSGVYDGLRVRKDPDDYALTDLRIGGWSFRTRYFSNDGRYKGTYINLNTPVELYPDRIRYVDLEVDVCLWPDGKTEKIDIDKLEDKVSKGYISESLAETVKEKMKEIMTRV